MTDFYVHSLWIQPRVTGYVVASDEVAMRIRERQRGVRVEVTGISIMPVFSQSYSRELCAQEIGLDPKRRTFLLMGGGEGFGALDEMAARLLTIQGDFQLITLAGCTEGLLKRLQSLADKNDRVIPHGFTTTIERVMATSDVAIGKAGGLTTSECLALGLPMIVVSPIPGQEERNADDLLEHGACLKTLDVTGLEYRMRRMLSEPGLIDRMAARAKAIGRPNAAREVLKLVLA